MYVPWWGTVTELSLSQEVYYLIYNAAPTEITFSSDQNSPCWVQSPGVYTVVCPCSLDRMDRLTVLNYYLGAFTERTLTEQQMLCIILMQVSWFTVQAWKHKTKFQSLEPEVNNPPFPPYRLPLLKPYHFTSTWNSVGDANFKKNRTPWSSELFY